jgi:hypothetical protein
MIQARTGRSCSAPHRKSTDLDRATVLGVRLCQRPSDRRLQDQQGILPSLGRRERLHAARREASDRRRLAGPGIDPGRGGPTEGGAPGVPPPSVGTLVCPGDLGQVEGDRGIRAQIRHDPLPLRVSCRQVQDATRRVAALREEGEIGDQVPPLRSPLKGSLEVPHLHRAGGVQRLFPGGTVRCALPYCAGLGMSTARVH